ncbi:hypothetical protein BSKO_02377 [Bryopsis sp. KO-2023]|nr:hypothetical protein BSKO_02377 [Bryopsis sp. KO-2023]
MLLGVLLGWVAKTTGKDETFQDWLSFKGYFFYFALLPPIIFEAGYSLDVKPRGGCSRFLQNAGAICAYAFIGTAMSTILIGFTMWAAGAMGLCFAFTFLESLIFGAVISATDPVSVLSVFQRLQAHPDLYTLVFGESIFNDAVAIVLFRSLLTFLKKDVTFKLVMFGMLTFVEIFVCSMLICIAYGFIASLAFKTDVVRNKHSPVEASLVVLLARYSFFTAESLG